MPPRHAQSVPSGHPTRTSRLPNKAFREPPPHSRGPATHCQCMTMFQRWNEKAATGSGCVQWGRPPGLRPTSTSALRSFSTAGRGHPSRRGFCDEFATHHASALPPGPSNPPFSPSPIRRATTASTTFPSVPVRKWVHLKAADHPPAVGRGASVLWAFLVKMTCSPSFQMGRHPGAIQPE